MKPNDMQAIVNLHSEAVFTAILQAYFGSGLDGALVTSCYRNFPVDTNDLGCHSQLNQHFFLDK